MSIRIQKYHSDYAIKWDAFIKQSINHSFIIERDFMDYHQDRFKDASLMVYKDDQLYACIPANTVDQQFYSHQGLSYGGLYVKQIPSNDDLKDLLEHIIDYLTSNYRRIEFRWQPEFYNPFHVDALAVLQELGFKNHQAFNNLFIDLKEESNFSSKKSIGYRNGKFKSLRWLVNQDFKSFWNQILEPQLASRHHSKPVHTLEEIELLASKFPENIKQYLAYEDDELLAGITFFIKGSIVKTQYASASELGMSKNANDFLYMESIKAFKNDEYSFIDCGHVNNPDGSINRGLQRFKEQLGAINQPIYRSLWTKI